MPRKGTRPPKERFKKYLSAEPILKRFDSTTTQADIAERLGVHEATIGAWKRGGTLNWQLADSIAIRLGTHPAMLWGDDWTTMYLPDLTQSTDEAV